MAWWKNGGMPNETLASYAEAVAAGLPFLDETSTTTTTTPSSISITEISIMQFYNDKVSCGHYTEVRISKLWKIMKNYEKWNRLSLIPKELINLALRDKE